MTTSEFRSMQRDFECGHSSPWVKRAASLPFPLGTLLFLTTSPIAREVFKRIAFEHSTDNALHPIYEYSPDTKSYSKWEHAWQSAAAAQSLRFRFNWLKSALLEVVKDRLQAKDTVKIFSLGSGSGFLYTHLPPNLSETELQKLRITFVDNDPKAIERAKITAKEHGLTEISSFENRISTDVLTNLEDLSVDIFESVGISEYVEDDWLRNETMLLYKKLAKDGFYIGAAISIPKQKEFTHKVLRWPNMNYRSREEVDKLLRDAGFSDIAHVRLGIFTGWIARK